MFSRATSKTGYPTIINGDPIRLDYVYGARYDRRDRHTYEPTFYRPFVERVHEGMTVMDVGAHIGIFAIGAALRVDRSGRVFAFECSPATSAALRRHVRYKQLESRIEVVEKAVADHNGAVRFFAYGDSMAASLARENVESLNPEERTAPTEEITVECVTLDKFCASRGIRPDLIKIDVEGAELQVLEGSRRTLRECHPDVLCEIHPQQMRNCGGSVEALRRLVSELSYRMTALDEPNPIGIFHAHLENAVG